MQHTGRRYKKAQHLRHFCKQDRPTCLCRWKIRVACPLLRLPRDAALRSRNIRPSKSRPLSIERGKDLSGLAYREKSKENWLCQEWHYKSQCQWCPCPSHFLRDKKPSWFLRARRWRTSAAEQMTMGVVQICRRWSELWFGQRFRLAQDVQVRIVQFQL